MVETSLRVNAAGTQPVAFFLIRPIIAVPTLSVFDSPGIPTGFVVARA